MKHFHPDQPDDRPPIEELTGKLREAVEHVRAKTAPQESVDRALDRASQPKTLPIRSNPRRKVIVALAAIAAMIIVGLLVLEANGPRRKSSPGTTESEIAQLETRRDTFKHSPAGYVPDGTSNTINKFKERPSKDLESRTESGELSKDETQKKVTNGSGSDATTVDRGVRDSESPPRSTAPPPPGIGYNQGKAPMSGGYANLGLGGGALGFGGGSGGPGIPNAYTGRTGDGGTRPGTKPGRPQDARRANGDMDEEADVRLELDKNNGVIARSKKTPADELTLKGLDEAERIPKDPKGEAKGGEEKPGENKDGGKEVEKSKDSKNDKEKKRQVWRRNGARPTFARVYVGEGNSLELVSLQVTVTIEGPRARTVVDHVFRNPHNQQLEGTFEYPLPAGASPSYFAMFLGQTRDTPPPRFNAKGDPVPVSFEATASRADRGSRDGITAERIAKSIDTTDWGRLQEARVVAKDKGLETYENIVRTRIDPALLEYAGGNTFSGRVFPIPAKGFNRVLIAYEELLPITAGQAAYRYALPDCDLSEVDFRLQASSVECKDPEIAPKEVVRQKGSEQLAFAHTWKEKCPAGDVVYRFTPAQPAVQAISGRQSDNGPVYLYARIRPELKVEKAEPFARQAVFLLDTSLSEHPDRFDRNMKLMRKILESDADIKQFNVLAFNVGTAWLNPKGWLENSEKGREAVLKRLDGLVLEGATDFGAALNKLAKPSFDVQAGTPLNVFVLSDGLITWGERDVNPLVTRFEERCPLVTRFHCYRTGLGADNLELFDALSRRGGGIYNCYEADLATAAMAHRSECLKIENVHLSGGPAANDLLIAGRKAAVYPGGELIVAAKAAKAGRTNVVVEGTFLGKKWVQEYPIEIDGYSDLAPRGWGEVAVASLLALNNPQYDGLVTAYCQHFNIGSRLASFLVLENEADYKRFNLEEERGKTLSGDLGKFIDDAWHTMAKTLSARDGFMRFMGRVEPRVKVMEGEQKEYVKNLLALLKDSDFEFPETALDGKLLAKADVPAGYLTKRDADFRDVTPYLMESRRRSETGDDAGAARVLSSVVEMYPGRGDALRLVGYRLLDMKQPAQAANLFRRVQEQRPFEPHSYRDLARALEDSGKYGVAALQYEIVLAGTWHNRFHDSLKMVVREEYAHMMREAIARKAIGSDLANHFGDRLEQMDPRQFQSDLRVTITWNTDNTDVDLWVIEPSGEKCYYQNRRTKGGGELTEDVTQGYGPERYQARKATKGKYRVIVHYFRPNPNLIAGETHVNVVVTRYAGTPQEVVERHTVSLKKHNEEAQVCEIEFE